jgi:hypothetical protein
MTLDWKQDTKYPHACWQLKPQMTDDTTKHIILATHRANKNSYLLARKQRTRITGCFKNWYKTRSVNRELMLFLKDAQFTISRKVNQSKQLTFMF